MDIKKFGELVKKLREEKGLTQGELADKLLVHRTAVNKWEKGKALPLNDTLVLLSEFFEISIDELVSGEINPKKRELSNGQVILSLLKSGRKSKRIAKYSILLFAILSIVFLIYYFFTTYNSIHVYLLYGDNDVIKVNDSLLIVSNEKVYLRLGSILDNNEKLVDIKSVNLIVDYKGEQRNIFLGDPANVLVEQSNNVDMFKDASLKNYDNDIYLIVKYENQEQKIKLNIKKDFENKSLIYYFKKYIVNDFEQINKEYYKINPKFMYDENNRSYILKNDAFEIVYYEYNTYLVIVEKSNKIDISYYYNFSVNKFEKTINSKYEVDHNLNEINIDYDNKDFAYFKKTYLDKYFSETIGVN